MHKNRKCRLCDDKDETLYHFSECIELIQKEFKTRHNMVRKVIHRELYKRLKFGHADKYLMHKPESVQENEIHEILWDFGIQTDHPILARRPDIESINKKKRICHLVNFAVSADHRMKIK